MKLYLVAGTYLGTQAEARAAAKEAGIKVKPEEALVEVPTDKPGLIAYLNSMLDSQDQVAEDHFETVVARQDPPVPSVARDILNDMDVSIATQGLKEARAAIDSALANMKRKHAPLREHMGMRIVEVDSIDDEGADQFTDPDTVEALNEDDELFS